MTDGTGFPGRVGWLQRRSALALKPFHPFRSERAKQCYLERYDERASAWPVPSEEYTVETSFGRTFVRASGPVGALPVVMLPGVGAPGLSFVANVGALSRSFRIFAVDNIHDHGRSVETVAVTGADDYTGWLDEVRTGLSLGDEVSLVGLSYGGWISAHYALRFPERIRRLVLLAPAGTVAPIPWGFIWRGILCLIPARIFMKNFMSWVATTEDPDATTRRRMAEMVEDGYLAQRCFAPRRMVPPLPLTDEQLGRLPSCTLFLAGDREVIFDPYAALARLGACAPQIRAELVPGTGHDFFVARADEVNRRVIEFLGPAR
jgi:pimeloyl-ACP methyl ester carboxylesterase